MEELLNEITSQIKEAIERAFPDGSVEIKMKDGEISELTVSSIKKMSKAPWKSEWQVKKRLSKTKGIS